MKGEGTQHWSCFLFMVCLSMHLSVVSCPQPLLKIHTEQERCAKQAEMISCDACEPYSVQAGRHLSHSFSMILLTHLFTPHSNTQSCLQESFTISPNVSHQQLQRCNTFPKIASVSFSSSCTHSRYSYTFDKVGR